MTKTLVRTVHHRPGEGWTYGGYNFEICCYHTDKQNKAGDDIWHYTVTYFDRNDEEVQRTLKPKTYRSFARLVRESEKLCKQWAAEDVMD